MITTFNVMPGLLSISTTGIAQLEGPEEVVGLLKVRADSHNLMDQVLDANDTILA